MAKKKFTPRIVILIATEEFRWEFSMVKGRLLHNGEPAPGPTAEQIAIASKAIADICATDARAAAEGQA